MENQELRRASHGVGVDIAGTLAQFARSLPKTEGAEGSPIGRGADPAKSRFVSFHQRCEEFVGIVSGVFV